MAAIICAGSGPASAVRKSTEPAPARGDQRLGPAGDLGAQFGDQLVGEAAHQGAAAVAVRFIVGEEHHAAHEIEHRARGDASRAHGFKLDLAGPAVVHDEVEMRHGKGRDDAETVAREGALRAGIGHELVIGLALDILGELRDIADLQGHGLAPSRAIVLS
ncbi:hypothetical protein ACFSZS_02510 [Seohaeicola zhoushanensis]